MREHLRAFENAKMQRIVRANANSPAGAAIRRKSSAREQDGITSDTVPLVPTKKAHWTTEERWAGETEELEEAKDLDEKLVAMPKTAEEAGAGAGKENSARKSSLGSKIGAEAFKATTGYVEKKDKYGMYPI